MVTARFLDHVGDKFGSNGCPALVLFVLSGIREQRNDSGNSLCACDLAGMNHDTELHKSCIDSTTTSVDDVHIILAHGFLNSDLRLPNTTSCDLCLG